MAVSGIKNKIYNSNTLHKIWNSVPGNSAVGEKTDKIFKKIAKVITPAENRLILGATALMSQPFIDARNKKVDQETRTVSVARTIAKIIAGTTTGFLIRRGAISAVKNWSKVGEPGIKALFAPPSANRAATDAYEQYQNTFGTAIALVAMMFTNFLIDAPLTKFLTNLFVDKYKGGNNETSK
ncbi:MAG: hypothetical protein LBJ74_04195 [Heliobacteriaceae bacterium]|jgi:hypothetical protein|nr:hypothetical protein [Heliobacteriaceae bacterium]